jgi:DMSO/TMAO reductase YedYZ molybdopterin-dependent catalytic subunit
VLGGAVSVGGGGGGTGLGDGMALGGGGMSVTGERLALGSRCSGRLRPMGFFQRNREKLVRQGIDPARLPPGQYTTDRFPVLHVGDVPNYRPGEWTLTIHGLVDAPFTIDFAELTALPSVTPTFDIHCVTKWSKFDTVWTGVRVRDLFERAGVRTEATHVMEHAESGYTTNLPLADITTDNAIIAYAYSGQPIAGEHGGPVRVVVPHLYFWKSAKWVRSLELIAGDQPGFWERNGYHMYGDPFREQRFTHD